MYENKKVEIDSFQTGNGITQVWTLKKAFEHEKSKLFKFYI